MGRNKFEFGLFYVETIAHDHHMKLDSLNTKLLTTNIIGKEVGECDT